MQKNSDIPTDPNLGVSLPPMPDFATPLSLFAEDDELAEEIRNLQRAVLDSMSVLSKHQVPASSLQRPLEAPSPAMRKSSPAPRTPRPLISLYPGSFKGRYRFFKGKERLGALRNEFLICLILLPVTLGLYWFWWLKKGFRELLWHSFKRYDYATFLPPLGLSLIYGLHFVFVYKLAKLLVFTEKQNGYRRTSPQLATALAVIPPLAMCYVQSRLNRHWKQHITHLPIQN
jgi:hypothetical protein